MDVEATVLQLLSYSSSCPSSSSSSFSFSSADHGMITERELERFMLDQIPNMSTCSSFDHVSRAFYPFFVLVCSRRFMFFLDSQRRGMVNVKRLAHSTVMEVFIYLFFCCFVCLFV